MPFNLGLDNPLGIMPGENDWMRRVGWGGIFGSQSPVGSAGSTGAAPKASWADKLVRKLDSSPGAQLGLRILANNRGGQSLGNVLGQSFMQMQDANQQSAAEKMRQEYMRAQIDKMNQPPAPEQDNSAPVIVIGPDGKPRYASRREAVGQQPYMQQGGESNGPGELAIAQALNDPSTPEAVKKDLRNLLARKYPGPQAQEPLIAIQTPDGRSVLVPRSQASGATPAAPRENFVPQEGERTSANYYGRMQAAESLLGDYKPSMMDYIAADRMMKGGPTSGSIANLALSEQGQKYYQAASDWVRSKLRKESGAVIAPEEMAQEIKMYFPTPGDSQATIAQKKKAREQAAAGMREMGGRAVKDATTSTASNDDPLGLR